MVNPDTGQPYIPQWLQGSAMFSPTMGPPAGLAVTVPERFDKVMHGHDWMTQADVEQQHVGGSFSPGR
jgi:hypothetical protein